MKNKFSVEFFPKQYTVIGLVYDEGEAENLNTGKVFPVYKISLGLLIVLFEFVFSFEKGEK